MKIQSLVLSVFLVFSGFGLNANTLSKDGTSNQLNNSEFLRKITPEFLYGYTDFNFDSTSGTNFNRYNGHSNLYSAGADHVSLGQTMMVGVYYFGIDTELSSQFLLTPGSVTTSEQTIHNHTIFGHLFKIFTPEIYADLGGGYGFNKFITSTEIATEPVPLIAQATNNNNNWFISFNGIYRKIWKKFLLRANAGVLYSQIDTGRYNYFFPATDTFQVIEPLTNKATLILENIELGYYIKPTVMPFLSGGLIQVAQFSNSRSLINPASVINGSLPQLNMDKSGFRVGGGIAITYKNATIRIEEKYYNASGVFQSYQTLAALEYQFG
ncbi:autotransporter outer membrane beta-barrel domain-containing protein [Legionella sp. PATHC035]|uniref:autotransporter outer membrane beta-barrel domain-containing protein n=1 Tax=Legionella sp. PATHC035 TaxID=2992040 RepID=UPI002244BA1A|nr:autotransporter outer membrane beta-barrel domain-containing protein [Legionella sp. PATHC035]MCW8409559.1 autotransporter outer membrane beta-barrel domain-containing protein [Legionella sp. PATHC035]